MGRAFRFFCGAMLLGLASVSFSQAFGYKLPEDKSLPIGMLQLALAIGYFGYKGKSTS